MAIDNKDSIREKRNLLSSFFVTVLIGLAYQEMIPVVRDAVRNDSYVLGTSLLAVIFFLTSMRFFIGNQLHLGSNTLLRMPGLLWLYDLSLIIIQCVVLIFIGGVSSVTESLNSPIGFVGLLVILYALDVTWILSQWVIGKAIKSCDRCENIPWAWFILNTILIALILALNFFFLDDWYSTRGIIILFALNLIAFVVDVILVDQYGVI